MLTSALGTSFALALILPQTLNGGSALQTHCVQQPSIWVCPRKRMVSVTQAASSISTVAGLSIKGRSETRAKPNQDAFWVHEDLIEGVLSVGVLDGHGKKGHDVAQDLAVRLPSAIAHELVRFEAIGGARDAEWMSEALSSAVARAQAGVLGNKDVLSGTSGSTMVACLLHHESRQLIVGNVGDSRAILGLQADSGEWYGTPLSEEHTTSRHLERQRIDAAQGRIDGNGNVWFGPVGIAMTRALGNGVMKGAGVICDPEIRAAQDLELPSQCSQTKKFTLLATDGVWDVMTNDEAASIVGTSVTAATPPAEGAKLALESLTRECQARWQAGVPIEQDVDDITAVLVLF